MSLVLDTSAALAFLNRSDPNHGPVKSALVSEPGQLIIPVGILAEIFYLIELRLGQRVSQLFCDDLIQGNFSLDCGTEDLANIKQLAERYSNVPQHRLREATPFTPCRCVHEVGRSRRQALER